MEIKIDADPRKISEIMDALRNINGVSIPVNYDINADGDYVDLGLPSGTLWATCNLGANKPEECGDFYMWGSVTPNTNTNCDWEHTPFNNGSNDYDKTFFNCIKDIVCPDGILSPEYDAATQNLGGKWRMPTFGEWKELLNNTSGTWTQVNGINGRRFTAANGNSIFIPASSCCDNSSLSGQGSYGYYWSSFLNVGYTRSAWHMYFDNGKQHPHFTDYRYYGFSIRPVYKP